MSANQANIYLFKINNRTLEKGGKYVCSQLTINTLFSSVSTNFEQVNVSSENTTFIPITKQNRHGMFYSLFIKKLNSNVKNTRSILIFQRRILLQYVVNKAKERVSKRVFQENKVHQISRKTNISYLPIRTSTDDLSQSCI